MHRRNLNIRNETHRSKPGNMQTNPPEKPEYLKSDPQRRPEHMKTDPQM